MNRRAFITLIGGTAAAWPLATRGQQGIRIPRVDILAPGPSEGADASRVTLNALVNALGELGYTEGRNIVIERRFGEANADRLREVAAELVKRQVDVIMALSTTAARPLKQATNVIPIVVVAMADPIEDELVASLARPGGNITGTAFLGPELVAKRLQLLSEVVPQHARVAVLWHPRAYGDRTMAGMLKEAEHAAQTLGMQLQFVPAASPDDIAGAFSVMTRERADALSVFPSPILFAAYGRIASIAAEQRLPAIYAAREGAEAGGLMSYGANLPDLARQTAAYVDKILKGAKHLPVQQPTKFELVINLKTARALGLTISRDFLLIADEVIE
jgi:putative ABC transport system substrate-binding protein